MERNHAAVGGRVNVGFDMEVAQFDRGLKGGHGVLGMDGRITAMRVCDRHLGMGVFQIWMHSRSVGCRDCFGRFAESMARE